MNSESTWYIIKALAAMFDGTGERLQYLESEIAIMGANRRDDLQRDFATIVAGLAKLSAQLKEA